MPAGLVESKERRATGTVVSVYRAGAAGIDVDEKYAVVCEPHGETLGVSRKNDGKRRARHADEWCAGCRDGDGYRPHDSADEEPETAAASPEEKEERRAAKAVAGAALANVRDDLEKALRALKRNGDTDQAEDEIKTAMNRIRDASIEISG